MLAILPAGGRAERFGGIFKELLPIGERDYLLSDAVRRAADLGADRFLVITNADKAATHARFLERHITASTQVTLKVRREQDEQLWDGLRAVLPYCEDRNLLVLPDTTWTCAVEIPAGCDFAFGVFETMEPGRFSVVDRRTGTIMTKWPHIIGPAWAWGCVVWSQRVVVFWRQREQLVGPYSSYDQAFAEAIDIFGFETFQIDQYNDLGTWEAYQRFVRAQ